MTRYSKPVWQMIEEAIDKLGEMTAKDAKDYIRGNYPKDNVNELTIGAQVIACSVNHTSAHQYTDSHRFLFYLGNGRFRPYHPTRDGKWEITSDGARRIVEEIKTNHAYFSQIGSNAEIRLPKEICEKLSLKERDFVAFVSNDQGNITLKKAELRPI